MKLLIGFLGMCLFLTGLSVWAEDNEPGEQGRMEELREVGRIQDVVKPEIPVAHYDMIFGSEDAKLQKKVVPLSQEYIARLVAKGFLENGMDAEALKRLVRNSVEMILKKDKRVQEFRELEHFRFPETAKLHPELRSYDMEFIRRDRFTARLEKNESDSGLIFHFFKEIEKDPKLTAGQKFGMEKSLLKLDPKDLDLVREILRLSEEQGKPGDQLVIKAILDCYAFDHHSDDLSALFRKEKVLVTSPLIRDKYVSTVRAHRTERHDKVSSEDANFEYADGAEAKVGPDGKPVTPGK
ncbi:MAG: hypothetical protein ACXWPM_07415 [Bdellovibrionota bacterium]